MGHRIGRPPTLLLCTLLLCALVCAAVAGTSLGSVSIDIRVTASILWHEWVQLWGISSSPDWPTQYYQIVWRIRLPRVILAALVGAGLAVVGAIMQAMVRNPLADPYLLGTSAGASVGAVSVMAFGTFAFAGGYAISLGAFGGALVATTVVYILARWGGSLQATRLILSGVAVGYMLTGITSLITLTAGPRELAYSVLTWILGSLAGAQWDTLGLPALVLACGLGWSMLQARRLNALLLGEETAATLGVDAHRLVQLLFVVVSLLTAVMVAVSGSIGFVGLVVPHVARMLVGSNHQRVLPVSALAGALFLVLVDLLSRTIFAPAEIPIGVITALIGGPFFIWMLVHRAPRTIG